MYNYTYLFQVLTFLKTHSDLSRLAPGGSCLTVPINAHPTVGRARERNEFTASRHSDTDMAKVRDMVYVL